MTTCRKPKSPREGHARDGDDGERRGLGRDDGERDGPPRDGVVGEEVALERAICRGCAARFAEAQAEERDADEVGRYESEVENAEPLRCEKNCKGVDGTGQAGSLLLWCADVRQRCRL